MSSTGTYSQREVWLAKLGLATQPGQTKIRPVIVVGKDATVDIETLSAPVTSQAPRNEYDVVLEHWQEAGLAKASVARTAKIAPIDRRDMVKKIGDLHPDDWERVLIKCRDLF